MLPGRRIPHMPGESFHNPGRELNPMHGVFEPVFRKDSSPG